MSFEKILYVGWGDMDSNSHMRNTAYLDKSGDVRMMFFSENGFPMSEFLKLRIGPVVLKDQITYHREMKLLDPIKITLALAGLADDGSRWIIRNDFFRPDGKLCASVTSWGGWLDLKTRKSIPAPEQLLDALRVLPKTEDFRLLEIFKKETE